MYLNNVKREHRADFAYDWLQECRIKMMSSKIDIKTTYEVFNYKYIDNKMPRIEPNKEKAQESECKVCEVIPKSTTDVLYDIGKTVGIDSAKVGVLNFASRSHPGGGFMTGALAQEESLCHESNLYLQLKDSEYYGDFYDKRKYESNEFYDNSMIVSDTTFKDDKTYKVITCGAINKNRVSPGGKGQLLEFKMKNRMNRILDMFYMKGCTTLILGAFGCGVFKNDPKYIAKTWKELLDMYGWVFESVYFAILPKPAENLDAFRKVFSINK